MTGYNPRKIKKSYDSKFQVRHNKNNNKKPVGFIIIPLAVWKGLNLKQGTSLKLTPLDDGFLFQKH